MNTSAIVVKLMLKTASTDFTVLPETLHFCNHLSMFFLLLHQFIGIVEMDE